MAIPVQQYPFMSFAQANPAIVGAQTGMNIGQQAMKFPAQLDLLKAQATSEPYKQALLQAQLQQAPLKLQQMEQAVKYGPLKQALGITSQEQQATRFGPAYQLARAIMAMPAGPRSAWIGDNQEAWNTVLSTLGQQALGQQEPSLAQLAVKRQVAELFPQPSRIPGEVDAPAPIADQYKQLQLTPQQLINWRPGDRTTDQIPRQPAGTPQQMQQMQQAQQQTQQQAQQQAQQQQMQPTAYEASVKQNEYGLDKNSQQIAFTNTAPATQRERWSNNMEANLQALGEDPTSKKRAAASVTMLHWLNDNRDEYAKRINNALQFVGADGKIKYGADLTARQKTQSLADYKWLHNDFILGLDNQIKFIEGMGATDQQSKELRNMIENATNWLSNPKLAKKNLNQMFSMWDDLAYSNLNTAQPLYKGVIQKMQGLPVKSLKRPYLGGGTQSAGKGVSTKQNDPLGIR